MFGREKCVPTFLRGYITSVYGYRSPFLGLFVFCGFLVFFDKNVMMLPTYCNFFSPHFMYCEDFSLSVYLDPDSPLEWVCSSLWVVSNPERYQHH